ncbi:hypothetical protein C8R43DRAFT_513999 [Mycena crocata]|nr:hypothetical protein C8R43DRAFT_513999 [Mycena crocata]
MAPQMSPPPSWVAFKEPDPLSDSNDSDLMPNHPPPRKRKKNEQRPSPHKRPKLSKTSSSQPANSVAGPSNSRLPSSSLRTNESQSSSGQKLKNSRQSASQPATNKKETASAGRTTVVKRTQREKARQRSSSDSDFPTAISEPLRRASQNGASLPSASAPVPKRGQGSTNYDRDKLRDRFSTASAPVKPRKKLANNEDVIDLSSGDEPVRPARPKPLASPDVIELSDSESESATILKKSAARKREKQKGVKNPLPDDREVVEIFDSDDEPAQPVLQPETAAARSRRTPLPDTAENGMVLDFDPIMDFGGEDMSGAPEPSSPGPPDLGSPLRRSPAPQRIDKTPPIASLSDATTGPSTTGTFRSSPAHDTGGDTAQPLPTYTEIPDDISTAKLPPAPDSSDAENSTTTLALPPPLTDLPNPSWAEDAPDMMPSNDPSPPTTPKSSTFLTEKNKSPIRPPSSSPILFRPNGLLSSHTDTFRDAPQTASSSRASPTFFATSTVPLVTETPPESRPPPRPPLTLQRPREDADFPQQSSDSPYKGVRNESSGKSAETLQLNLGLSAKRGLPKIDLRSLKPPKPALPKRRPLPPVLPGAPDPPAPASTPQLEQDSKPVEGLSASSSSVKPQQCGLRSLVDVIITAGQHNVQSSAGLPRPPTSRQPPSPPPVTTAEHPTIPSPAPAVKLEEAPSERSTVNVNNSKEIIDLTWSDEDGSAPQAAPRVSAVQRAVSRLSALLDKKKSKESVSSDPSSKAGSLDQRSPSTRQGSRSNMDIDMDLPLKSDGVLDVPDRPTITTDPRRPSPPPSLLSQDVPSEMDVDGQDGMPPQLDAPLVPATLGNLTLSTVGKTPAGSPQATHVPEAPDSSPVSLQTQVEMITSSAQQPNQDTDPHPTTEERRSYDDVEVYYLEYIGHPMVYALPEPEVDAEDIGTAFPAARRKPNAGTRVHGDDKMNPHPQPRPPVTLPCGVPF